MSTVFKAVLGAVLAALLILVLRIAFFEYITYRVKEEIGGAMEETNRVLLEEQQRIQQQQWASAEAAQRQRQLQEQQRQAKAAANAEQRRRKRAAVKRQKEKERAWDAWYQEPEGCDNYDSNERMVKCVNHMMVAKKNFDRLWRAREIGTGTP